MTTNMHTPKSWDDKSLLGKEPFLSTFFAQKLETTRRSDLRRLTANVVQQLKWTKGGVSGFQTHTFKTRLECHG